MENYLFALVSLVESPIICERATLKRYILGLFYLFVYLGGFLFVCFVFVYLNPDPISFQNKINSRADGKSTFFFLSSTLTPLA